MKKRIKMFDQIVENNINKINTYASQKRQQLNPLIVEDNIKFNQDVLKTYEDVDRGSEEDLDNMLDNVYG